MTAREASVIAVVTAAQLSLKTTGILGSYTAMGKRGDPMVQQFAVDPQTRAMVWRIVAGKLKGHMTVAVGREAWLCMSSEADALKCESSWFKMEGVDFPAFGPTRPLFWLQGAISASLGPSGEIIGSLSRDEAAANVTGEDPEALEESWLMLKSSLRPEALNAIGYQVRLDSRGRIASARIQEGADALSAYEYTYPLETVRIIPPESQDGRDRLQVLFADPDEQEA